MNSRFQPIPFTAAILLASAAALPAQDLNGDFLGDLAVGIPKEDTGATDSGAVQIILSTGPTVTPSWLIYEDGVLLQSISEAGDNFGAAIAYGDFNGDGREDIAIGAPGKKVDAKAGAGMVTIVYGEDDPAHPGEYRLYDDDVVLTCRSTTGIASQVQARFGASLAAEDFNGDGHDDLAIGVPGYDLAMAADAGAVVILYGSAAGISSGSLWHQDTTGVPGTAEAGDQFGFSLAAGRLGSGPADLAIGSPYEGIGSATQAGAVFVLYGSGTGLTATGAQVWTQNSASVLDAAETNDEFGFSLMVAPTSQGNGVIYDDLIVGIPFEDVGANTDAGAIAILKSAASGLSATGNRFLHQNSSGVPDSCEAGDQFGYSLSALQWQTASGSTYESWSWIAVGVPGESVGSATTAGAIQVCYSEYYDDPSGSHTVAFRAGAFVTQSAASDPNGAESGDRFGMSSQWMGVDPQPYLAVGIPGENVGSLGDAGAVEITTGYRSGSVTSVDWLHQDSPGMPGVAETGDSFGRVMGATSY